jgi:polyphosphate kinase 2 (PPK2 family)
MLEQVDLSLGIPKEEYNELVEQLGYRLGELQRRCRDAGIPLVVVLEEWDAAGKGGSVNQLVRLIDPRGFKVYATGAPTENERMRPFLWRFAIRMPHRGFMAIFIRSWYGRVLVERVEKLAPEDEWRSAYEVINAFERQLVDESTVLVKFWLHISKKEQRRRLRRLEKDPYESWKIKPANWESHNNYRAYVEAVEEMLQQTSNPAAHERGARAALPSEVLEERPQGRTPGDLRPELVRARSCRTRGRILHDGGVAASV